jgi:aminoglycoside phosphotransferase (APT) family kinase protein
LETSHIAERLAKGGRVQELSGIERAIGANRVYRIWSEDGTRVAKLYGTPARDRREQHALDALHDLAGMPVLLERGTEEDTHWAIFEDAGRWSLGTLPENPGLAKKAGEILRGIHDAPPERVSNLARGIDQEWVTVDFISTFRRLERYRGRLGLSAEAVTDARNVRPPYASSPRIAHTNTVPENFLVDDAGNVTLINWEWATLAPPEWDLAKATWLIGLQAGPNAAAAFQDGYGKRLERGQLDRWTVYHAGMMLVYTAENSMRSGLTDYGYLVAELRRAVTGSIADTSRPA